MTDLNIINKLPYELICIIVEYSHTSVSVFLTLCESYSGFRLYVGENVFCFKNVKFRVKNPIQFNLCLKYNQCIVRLVLGFNYNTVISILHKFTHLRTLELCFNTITKIGYLGKLTQLTYLNLCYNSITKIENLDQLPRLQELGLIDNTITKIENLDQLPKLQRLGLHCNLIDHEIIEKYKKEHNYK